MRFFVLKRVGLVLAAFVLWGCQHAWANESISSKPLELAQPSNGNKMEPLTIDKLIEQLLINNPSLRSIKGAGEAAQLGVVPASALDNPTFNLTQDPMRKSPLALATSTGMAWSISQNLPWPGKKTVSGEIAQAQANYSQKQVDQLKVQLIGQLKSTWINWQLTESQIEINKIQSGRLEQIKDILKLRYANNAAIYADYLNAQVTQAQIKSDLLGLERQAQALLAQITVLIGWTDSMPIQLVRKDIEVEKSKIELNDLLQKALSNNPSIKASKYILTAAQKNVELAELNLKPDFNIGMTSHSASPPWGFTKTDSYGLSIGVTLPIYLNSKERLLIDQAKAQLRSALDADEALEQQVKVSVETSYLQWLQSVEQLKLTQERILEQAKIGYKLNLGNYTNGQATYMDLLNAYNTLKAAELTVEQFKSASLQAKIALDVAVGYVE